MGMGCILSFSIAVDSRCTPGLRVIDSLNFVVALRWNTMKQVILGILVFAFCAGSILMVRTGRVEAVAPRTLVKDIPEYGVRIAGPGDPIHQTLSTAFKTPSSNPIFERLKPFSAFLRNTGSQNIVAYWLTWELMKPDGTFITRGEGGVNAGVLTGDVSPALEGLVMNSGYAVGKNADRLITP